MAGAWKKAVAALVVGYAAFCVYRALYSVPPVPDLPQVNYWGPGQPRPDDVAVRSFKINVADKVLEDLQRRLDLELRLQPSLEGVNFEYGFNSEELRRVVRFWREEYRWRDREALLNALPQFVTQVFGLKLHFIHAKPKNVPKNVQVLPLLLLHGWPGSIKEFHALIPELTRIDKDRNFVFEVIAPSLPGYAFSEASHKPGLHAGQMAVMFKHLMTRLGFQKFYMQGGDWGSLISTNLAILYPETALGLHLNMCGAMSNTAHLYLFIASLWPSMFVDDQLAKQIFPVSSFMSNMILESGYMHLQATKPDTIGAALNNSPVGLAAYILEKFSSWTDMAHRGLSDGGLTKKFTLPDLLDNIMLYWVTGSITSSVRLYSECFSKKYMTEEKWNDLPVHAPTFCGRFPHELFNQPNFMLRLRYKNLVSDREVSPSDPLYAALRPATGGHFAAMEEPRIVANSVVQAVKLFRSSNK